MCLVPLLLLLTVVCLTCRAVMAVMNWVMGCADTGRDSSTALTWGGMVERRASSADTPRTCAGVGTCARMC